MPAWAFTFNNEPANLVLLTCYLHIYSNFFFLFPYYLQGFIECLCTHLKKLSEIVKVCFEEIAEWRHLQQRSLCGFPCPPSLDKLQEVYVHKKRCTFKFDSLP